MISLMEKSQDSTVNSYSSIDTGLKRVNEIVVNYHTETYPFCSRRIHDDDPGMRGRNDLQRKIVPEHDLPAQKEIEKAADELCENAIQEAKSQLHPLLQNTELDRLEQRAEFLQAFKSALEGRVARKLAAWQPSVQAVFKYEETRTETMENGDATIHLLVKVPRWSDAVRELGRKLDRSLVNSLRQMPWQRFQMCQSIVAVHQVTPRELRHGIGYGAMFCAVYTVPVKVWPPDRRSQGQHCGGIQ